MSRMKNVGTLVPKALIGMAVAAMIYWACGFAFAFGNGEIIGSTGFFLRDYGDPQEAFGIMGLSDAMIESKWLFQFAFCAVCLAIVWGSTLERIKFHAHADLRARLRRLHLPAGLALGLRRRLAADQRRHAGLRRLDGRPPRRRDRRARRAARARPAPRQVRLRRQAAPDPGPQHVHPRPRHVHPAHRLVRLQRRLRPGRHGRPLRRGRDGHDARRLGRHPRRLPDDGRAPAHGRHRHGLQRPHRRPRRHHGAARATWRTGRRRSSASSAA